MTEENNDGIILIFVLFAMIILLVFTVSLYFLVDSKSKLQEAKSIEYKEIYLKNYDEISNVEYADKDEIIPVYNINELDIVGTSNFLQINNKIYECGIEKSYVLKDNIVVDIEENVKNKLIGFNDYKFFSSNYKIDNASYDIYYYKNNKYWKAIAYKKYKDNDYIIKNKVYTDKEFSNLDGIPIRNGDYEFTIIWSNENNELKNESILVQNVSKNNILNINDLEVFKKNKEYLPSDGEYYIFIYVGDYIN